MAEYTAYFNGEWMPFNEVKISPLDRGFEVGDVVFDVARTFDGKSFRMKEHVDRLYRSLKFVRIDPGLSFDEFMQISEEAIARNEPLREDVGDFTVRQFVTRGEGGWTHQAGPPAVCVMVRPINFGRFSKYYTEGAHGVIPRTRSYSSESLDPKVKHYSRMNFNMAELEVSDIDPDAWPILMDVDGNLTEGTGYNFFMVTDGVIRTSNDRSILQGISRGMVFDLANQLDIEVVEEDLQPYDLYTADEVFFSGTSPCVLPVTRVDKRQVSDGKPGRITQQLLAAWSERVGVDVVGQAQRFGG
ncbi:MAG: aminotransferase class IV [Chloroflexi bacterium]|nr:aminotransferase class IV [Chloroflexota bacterium]MCI0796989.1 aminotransferase class IV [Chloroflexota bacterium]MCI0822954.1 aminotransferase class IV [Chloroflexota bacterium]MCI0868569.1 aminotransferase class IV [Chloroflexota bacterium]MCI0887209.1 aminotransferase class IV [Chloroflexota bacterium]